MKLSNLARVLRAAGLTVVETSGWASRGYAGQDLKAVRGVLWHHTATNRTRYALADAPTLAMCVGGRPDLPGPLCNIVLGRSGTVYLVAAGVANHAGAGSAAGIPKDMGNHYLIGIEMESSGIAPWDWTDDQLRVAAHLGAALERGYLLGLPADQRLQLGHMEYSSQGKIDPAGWPGGMAGLRASINTALSGSAALAPQGTTISATIPALQEEGNDMPLVITQPKGDPGIYIGNGLTYRRIPDVKTLTDIQSLAKWGVYNIFKDGQVMDYPLAALGKDLDKQEISAVQAESICKRTAALLGGAK